MSTNPPDTHKTSSRRIRNRGEKTATALHYQPGSADIAPVVLAQEKGELAEQLLLIAKTKGVPIKEDADLASLLAAASVGEEIPIEAFLIVAELFRFLYQEKGVAAPAVAGETSRHWQGNHQTDTETHNP